MALKVTREQLDQFAANVKRLKELAAEADPLKKAIKQFEQSVQAEMVSSKQATAKRLGWVFSIFRGNASVKWKEEFIRVAGDAAASELSKEAHGTGDYKLAITPPQDLAGLFAKDAD